jgi:ParB-like chromosome segregation protein Spo0J
VAIGLIENIQRADLNPLEEAGALERLLGEFGLTHQQIAEAVGKSRTTVTNLLRLLELNPDVKAYVEHGQLEMGHARALLGLKGAQQSAAAKQVVSAGLSVRETERLVRRLQQAGEAEPAPAPKRDPDPNVRIFRTTSPTAWGPGSRSSGDQRGRKAGDRLQQPRRARRHPLPHQMTPAWRSGAWGCILRPGPRCPSMP